MLKKGNILTLTIFFIASVFLTPVFASFYEKITGTKLGYGSIASIGFSHPEYFEGFFFSLAFVFILGIIIFAGRPRYLVASSILFLEAVTLLFVQYFGLLIVVFSAAFIAIVLGEAILLAKRKIVDKK